MFRKIIKYKEAVIVSILILLAVVFSMSQTIIYAVTTPKGFAYQFVHNYPDDYYYYLHLMRQGFDGSITATSRMTEEDYKPIFVNPLFLILGHVSRITGISIPLIYTFSRFTGGALLLFFVYFLIKAMYPDLFVKRLIAFGFVILGGFFFEWGREGLKINQLVHEWTEMDPIFRIAFIPHHLFSKVFMVATFVSIYYYQKTKKLGFLLLTILFTLLSGFSNPVVLATFLPILSVWFLMEIIPNAIKKRKMNKSLLLAILMSLFVGVSAAIYHRIIQQGVFPWTSYLDWEKVKYNVNIFDYLKALGPLFVIFLLSIKLINKNKVIGNLLISWVFVSFLLLFILGGYLPLTNSRFLGGYQFIPIAIGSVVGFVYVINFLSGGKEGNKRIYSIVIIGIIVIYSTISIYVSFMEHMGYVRQNRNNLQVYIPDTLYKVFAFLDKNTLKETVVMAPFNIGTMIPAFTSNRVVVGHQMMTNKFSEKLSNVDNFYRQNNINEVDMILKKHNVSYVLVKKDDIGFSELMIKAGWKEKYGNEEYAVYGAMIDE